MTDELKFFDPETGAELHRVPDGATILKGMPYGFIRRDGNLGWRHSGSNYNLKQDDSIARFTREPIAPPKPPLPTEPGLYLDKEGDLWELTSFMRWKSLVSSYYFSPQGAEFFAPFTPVTATPTETWDRLRVLDPEDIRDRVDAEGCVWRYSKRYDRWDNEDGDCFYYLEAMDSQIGPFRFADEVSDDE